ncbi:bifunctional riboflavin kinase/FAD synthetase [candidate division KSB1 bacterium]|nr:bifunctional riboflavin kinase/FAD synthetase [candidate division KSB1 bacterium]MBL7094875.1 bifunctional riboflavin kinase/FAD synthetase [candidate division KSB1 bacterium]
MEIISRLQDLKQNKNCVITTGTFDGVHLGHQSIINQLHKTASSINGCATVITFEPHPQFVLKPNRETELKLLTTLEEKISIFDKLQIDRLVVLTFTHELSNLTSQEFVENILIQKIGFKSIIIGYDHAFGKGRSGNIKTLSGLKKKYNYSIVQMTPFAFDDTIISSTKIRQLILSGNVSLAAKYLGREYKLAGKVIKGEGRGKTFSIPTANVFPLSDKKLIPQNGIYAGRVKFKNKKYKAAIYIGKKPTFSNNRLFIEAYFFEFSGNIYNEMIEIEFTERIRDDIKFDNAKKLYTQIEKDKKKTLEILSKN